MVNGVIFDMDGLMFDTERIWDGCWEPVCNRMGVSYKKGLSEAVRGTSGETLHRILRSFYGENFDAPSAENLLYEVSEEIFAKPVPKKVGLDELLSWLEANHIPAAVASSCRGATVSRNLNNWNLVSRFKAVITGEMVSMTKPSPDIFLLAAQKLGTRPEETLVLEDSYNGIRAGAAGGFITVMIPDLCPVTDEIRTLCTAECDTLHEVCRLLQLARL